jgi:hypothetical protein
VVSIVFIQKKEVDCCPENMTILPAKTQETGRMCNFNPDGNIVYTIHII